MEKLEPHEQLDLIDQKTLDNGNVLVKIDKWEKKGSEVKVVFHTPSMAEKTEAMDWPRSKTSESKFVRFIEHTPYNMMNAEDINDDDDLWIEADPDTWNLQLPIQKSRAKRFLDKFCLKNSNKILKHVGIGLTIPVLFWAIVLTIADWDMYNNTTTNTYLDNREKYIKNIGVINGILYCVIFYIGIIVWMNYL